MPSGERETTPAQWIRRWENASDARKLNWAARILIDAEIASNCFVMNHEDLRDERDRLAARLNAVQAALEDVRMEASHLRGISSERREGALIVVRRLMPILTALEDTAE